MGATYDIIVVGVGTMGAAACDALARRGARVLGLERFGIPHPMGAHHGQSRMFRMSYYEHPDYVPLLKESFTLWQDLEASSGTRLFRITGGLYMAREGGEMVRASTESARLHGLEHETLSHADLARRYPLFRLPEGYTGLHEPRAGFIVPELAVSAMASRALEHGATIRGHETVLDWTAGPDHVTVRTDRDTHHAGRLVFTCGAWTGTLLRDLGVNLLVTRQVMGWVWPPEPAPFALGRFPCWAIEHGDGSLHYGFPMLPWHAGLKVARHARGRSADPDTLDRRPVAEDESDFRPGLQRHLPTADGPLLSMAVCTYTNSPDSHFIIDTYPRHPAVSVACGFSGHGFKFAPVVGEILADLALDGRTSRPAAFLGLSRFGARD